MGLGDGVKPQLEEDHLAIYRKAREGDYFDGVLPSSLSRLSVPQIDSLHTLCTAWLAYVSHQKLRYIAKKNFLKAKKDTAWGSIRDWYRTYLKSQGVAATARNQAAGDLAILDMRFIEANAAYLQVSSLLEIIEVAVEIAERNVETVSRSLTAKGIVVEGHARGRADGGSRMPSVARHISGRGREEGHESEVEEPSKRRTAFTKFSQGGSSAEAKRSSKKLGGGAAQASKRSSRPSGSKPGGKRASRPRTTR